MAVAQVVLFSHASWYKLEKSEVLECKLEKLWN